MHKDLTSSYLNVLIEHIDGPQPIPRGDDTTIGSRKEADLKRRLLVRCVNLGWLKFDRAVSPTTTEITDKGRPVLAEALGEYADALCRALGRSQFAEEAADKIPEPEEFLKAVELAVFHRSLQSVQR